MNNKIFFTVIVLFFSLNLFSIENVKNINFYFGNSYDNFKVNLLDATSDGNSKNKKKIDNPFKNIDGTSWIKEKYRLEKILVGIGIASFAVGLPIFFVGLFQYLFPQTDKSTVGDAVNISMMAVGGSLIVAGGTVAIVGAVRWGQLKSKEKVEVSFSIGFLRSRTAGVSY
jgi:hypothetical protein